MSFNKGEVKINSKLRQGVLFLAFLGVAEFVLTTVFVITFASNILFPEQTKAVANQVAKVLSYEGRLTDASGNALGGSGTNYCFRFSIYDNPTVGSGTKLWPSGTPVRNTVNVTNGVFSVGIGTSTSAVDAAPDDLSLYNFYTNDSAFLNVEATSSLAGSCSAETSFVTLSPRQPLYAVAYARATRDVYGAIFKTDNVNGKAQVGDGTGTTGDPILLSLDWKSNVGSTFSYVGQSCSANGAMWYNSSTGNALICSNNLIHQMGVDSTTTIAAIGTNGTTPISAGTVVFSNGNGVTFGQNGSTITASAAGGGGGNVQTLSIFSWPQGPVLTSVAQGQGSLSFGSLRLEEGYVLTATRAAILASGSISSNVSGALSISIGIYTLNGSTLSLITQSSGTQSYSYTSNASSAVSGLRRISVPLNMSMTPGQYYYGIRISTAGAGSFSIARGAGVTAAYSGNLGAASATNRQIVYGVGVTSSNAMQTSVAATAIQAGGTAGLAAMPWILFTNLDAN